MRIGFDAKRLFCNATGLGNYSRTLVENLHQYYPESELHLYTPKITLAQLSQPFLQGNYHIQQAPPKAFKAYWRSRGIIKQLLNDNIQLYHGLSHELPWGIHKTKIPTIVTIHDLIFKRYPELYPWLDRQFYEQKMRYCTQYATGIIAISEQTKADLQTFYQIPAERIQVIYQSCQSIFYTNPKTLPAPTVPKSYLLWVGSFQKRKNFSLLLQAYTQLAPEDRLPIVAVGGNSKHREELEQQAAANGLSPWLHWHTEVSNTSTLHQLYQHASLLVYPSIFEGFGLPIAEALLTEVPVVAAQSSSLPEAGGPNSIYIDPASPVDLAAAIKAVLQQPTKQVAMGSKGRAYALQQFHPQTTSRTLWDYYQSIMNRAQ